MNFWDMSSSGIGLVASIPNIVLSTRFMMILWPFLSPWDTIMQSKFIEILFCFYIGKINDLTISCVYFFRNQNLYECLLMRLPAYHLPIRSIFLRLDIKRKTLIINYQCFYKSVGVTRPYSREEGYINDWFSITILKEIQGISPVFLSVERYVIY